MPIRGDELVAMSEVERMTRFRPTKCVFCGVTLDDTTTGRREVKAGCACGDCYFEKLSDLLEEHPVGIPRMHGGR